MTIENLQAIASIAQSLTVTGVLLVWVWREIKRGDSAVNLIVEDWKDLSRERMAKNPENLPN